MRNANDLCRFSKGIHIERLKKDELEYILREYYKVEIPQNKCNTEKKDLKNIYFNSLSSILQNGYHIPIGCFKCADPYLYYSDMVMMLYFYIMNLASPLSANQLPISTGTQTELKTIEQSGFGAILGIRRNNEKTGNTPNADELQKYEYTKSVLQKAVIKESTAENAANSTKQAIIRDDHGNKYSIPVISQNVLIALIKSRKYNPYLFALSECEFEDEALSLFMEYQIDLILPILSKKYKDTLEKNKKAGDLVSSNLHSFVLDKNFDNYDKFLEQYYQKLDDTIKKEDGMSHLKEADLYLTELLLAHTYYVHSIRQLNKGMDITHIDEDLITQFMDTVYNVSESMLCFSRQKHVDIYIEILRKLFKKYVEKKELTKLMMKMNKTERYTRQKFGPALYYCFLYYIIDEANKTSSTNSRLLSEIEKEVGKCFQKDFMLDLTQIKKLLSNDKMNLLLFKRKQGFLLPLKYSMEKALF